MTDSSDTGAPSPIKLEPPPGARAVVDKEKAREFTEYWREQLLGHRQKVQEHEANGGNDGESNGSTVLCDRIRLSDRSYTAEAAAAIASFLTEPFEGGLPLSRGIVEADLSDIIASRKTEEGLQVLQTICHAFADAELVDVDLSDNAIGEQGIGPCKTVLGKKSLERLALCNNGLSQETMAQVADILTCDEDGTGCIAGNLTKIHFYNNMSGEGGCREFARILEKSTKLIDIRFSSTRAGKAGSDIVASALDASLTEGRNSNLTKLDLCDNVFTNKASCDALFRVLGATTSLTYLDLRDCELEDEGVKKICHALFESDSALEHLDLSGNDLEKRGAKHVADYLRDCGGKLKVLRLEDNELTSKGVESIAAAFHSSEDSHNIEEIQLNTCLVGAIGARALIDAFGPEGTDLPHLKKISLNGNSFTGEVVGELGVAFDERLGEMDDNDSDGDADDDLSEEDEEEDEDEGAVAEDAVVDDLAEAMNQSLLV
ncbi:hypothetical protein ACHAWF_015758 [Thalassiosira exigua]